MKNHIRGEKAGFLQHDSPLYYLDKQKPSKWNHSPSRNENSRKNHKGSTHGQLVYLKDHSFEVIREIK
jgi:hypothetical protein